jgi:hypothetical protein
MLWEGGKIIDRCNNISFTTWGRCDRMVVGFKTN